MSFKTTGTVKSLYSKPKSIAEGISQVGGFSVIVGITGIVLGIIHEKCMARKLYEDLYPLEH